MFAEPQVVTRSALHGDKKAMSSIYEYGYKPLYNFIYLRLGNIRARRDVALDLTEDSFYKFLKFIGKNEAASAQVEVKPMPLLYTIARNTIIDYARKKKEVLIETEEFTFDDIKDDSQSSSAPYESCELHLLGKKLMKLLDRLTSGQREIISLTFYEELETSEVAYILEVSEEAVRQQKSRAIRALRYLMRTNETEIINSYRRA